MANTVCSHNNVNIQKDLYSKFFLAKKSPRQDFPGEVSGLFSIILKVAKNVALLDYIENLVCTYGPLYANLTLRGLNVYGKTSSEYIYIYFLAII